MIKNEFIDGIHAVYNFSIAMKLKICFKGSVLNSIEPYKNVNTTVNFKIN